MKTEQSKYDQVLITERPQEGRQSMYFPQLIKRKRIELGETQTVFAKRFGATATAVSLWEAGLRQAPYPVLEYAVKQCGEVWETGEVKEIK